ncbi:MAG: DUF6328 family protein [Promicromonosporaceae bacterium]|nr:DUF6328 family protein [Promicromonosporaceae bacterium]
MDEEPGTTGRVGRSESIEERSDRNWTELLQELRVMQTGVQILTGFLLTLPFQPRFAQLTGFQRGLYLVLIVLAALTTGLAVAPVALHRGLFHRRVKARMVTVGDWLTRATLLLLAALVTGVLGLVFDVVAGRAAGVTTAVVSLVVLGGLWAVVPGVVRARATAELREGREG